MIFYFSGTGNSLWVAKELSTTFKESLISVADELTGSKSHCKYDLKDDEKLFFVFPVHSWGPAALVLKFIKKLTVGNYTGQQVFLICTCGDNCGYTHKIIRKALRKKSIRLTKAYSVQMPNNYILMSGFNTDPKELEEQKLQDAPDLLRGVVNDIKEPSGKDSYTVGSSPFLKSYVVYPLFRKFVLGKTRFYAKESCTSCKLCEKICPTKTIVMENGKPVWGNACVQCVACIHHCPVRAIEYGNVSQDKGRYVHPE
ncbi:MAG: EFR1 family ferrodoxin [Bacteroidales bacterium]|jgi:NAD-dependent dihydropyrimidine dehydrogenase PreA subunit/flavodoxin|nr:EFR1 family ferrodoxin [Bacteroidales bacterium]